MKKLNKVGEKHLTNEGYTVEIIEYFGWRNCTIKFNDGVIIKNREYQDILKGRVRNFNHKSVYNIGFTGIGEYSNKKYNKIYIIWSGMLERCYSEKKQQLHPSYIGVTVCEEWHNFQNFAKWYEENYIEGFQLDKDILVKGNKIYSPETCCFVPQEINSLFTFNNINRGEYLIGVNKQINKYKAQININSKQTHLGMFNTPEEAFQAYKTAKEDYIKEVADRWKDKITEQTYQAMYNYQVEITD